MKFYLTVLVLFGIFVAGAMNLPRITAFLRKRDIETTAKDHILARLKDPAGVKWNHKNITTSGKTTLLTYDVTGVKKGGGDGAVREVWTFEFDSATKDLLSVKEKPVTLNIGRLPPTR